MTPTETLKHEHQIILLVLGGAEREAHAIRSGASPDLVKLREIIDFARNFMDRCHHGKEERHLFELMIERGMSKEFGPIGVMLHEHEQGRSLVQGVAAALAQLESGEQAAAATLARALIDLSELLRAHIYKEDNILYPMADRLLSPADQQALAEAFERVEADEMGAGTHERYHELAHRLAQT